MMAVSVVYIPMEVMGELLAVTRMGGEYGYMYPGMIHSMLVVDGSSLFPRVFRLPQTMMHDHIPGTHLCNDKGSRVTQSTSHKTQGASLNLIYPW